ncbi:hypothetical protein BpHYR1_054516 [Brachionus plicatilis]|uniref:Uncharacterized protein n=1 Tax=Brachionus plicatilis TaxID=10195 RepID=A0A3M7S2C3_BRAPC|nr:hypothetical protein BpHYR1_054516 [Brachionus plicatilis]
MVGDKWHSLNGGDKYGSVFYLKTGGPCFNFSKCKNKKGELVFKKNMLNQKVECYIWKNILQESLFLLEKRPVKKNKIYKFKISIISSNPFVELKSLDRSLEN